MMRIDAVIAEFADLDIAELNVWIEQHWIVPTRGEDNQWIFHDIDLARIRLVYDLRRDLNTPEETMSLVLSLLDQVYELRRNLKAMTRALESQTPDVQHAVRNAIRSRVDEE